MDGQKVQLTLQELIEIRTWQAKLHEMLINHESDLREIFLQLDKNSNQMELITRELQDVSRDARDLKQIAIEQRQAVRNLWYGVILAAVTALIGKFITVAK